MQDRAPAMARSSTRQPRFKQPEGEQGGEELESGGGRECWICFGSGPGLIAPCQCSGSMRWVHRQCLDRWRVDAANPLNFTHCRHCGAAFQMVLRRPAAADDREFQARRRRFVRGVISDFARRAALLQLVLCALAMAIRTLDSKERLVVLFDLRQMEGTPPAGIGDYWNAILHHKSTYYLAAVLVGFFCVGLAGTVVLCRRLCCTHQRGGNPCPGSSWDRCFSSFPDTPPPRTRSNAFECPECADDCGDCCATCCRDVECPCCEQPGGPCPDASCCPSLSGDRNESENPCAACLQCALVIFVVAFVVAGVFFALVASIVWLHRVLTRYTQIVQLRALTHEYIVRDLSEDAAAGSKQLSQRRSAKQEIGSPAPAQQEIGQARGTPPGDAAVHQSLMMDLQAVFGTR